LKRFVFYIIHGIKKAESILGIGTLTCSFTIVMKDHTDLKRENRVTHYRAQLDKWRSIAVPIAQDFCPKQNDFSLPRASNTSSSPPFGHYVRMWHAA